VGEVTRADIRAYLDYLATSRGNSNVTRARKLAAIKSFFNYLVENEGLETGSLDKEAQGYQRKSRNT